ncbi:MAG: 2Fe-2S iron-sulfur cluster-binding protein [Pseudolabrys sp.]|jgi:2Fe-2S ferredoxin
MPKITYIEHDGAQYTVEAELGSTVMETALRNAIASIVAECGGGCTCATCLMHVDEKWFEVVGPPSAEEEEMLDTAFEVKPTSPLSCPIKVTEALDGLSNTNLSRPVSVTLRRVVVSRPVLPAS